MRYQLSILLFCLIGTLQAQFKVTESHTLFTEPHTPEAHASTIVETVNGSLLAAWFAGEYESHKDVGIYLAKYNGKTWTKAQQVAYAETIKGKTYPCWNPVLVKNKDNTIFLYYKVGPNPREWWGMVKKSFDGGNTWSKAEKLPSGFLGPVRVKSLELPNGSFLHPSSTETPDTDYWSMHFEISDKNGENWKNIPVACDSFQVIQPTLITLPDNKLMMMARSRHNKVIASQSADWGKTWSKLYPIDLPNPNSGIDAINTGKSEYVMVYNPLRSGKDWWEGRNQLVLGHSTNGHNWSEILSLEDHEKGEFSYPAIIKTTDGKIHITYTFNRKHIKHIVVEN